MKLPCGIVGWIALTVAAQANVPPLPLYPISNSFAPFIDTNGYVNPIIALGSIDFGQRLTLPLVLNFSSAIRAPSPEFGQGWECPLFEARIVDAQPNEKKVELLGGKTIYLVYNQRTDRWKHFYSDHWTGQAKGEDFELDYDNVWKFSFHNGLISSMTTPSGRTILWNRAGEKLMSMNELGKSPAMQIVYDNLGFAKQILLNPDKMGVSKITYDFGASLVYAGIDKIHCYDGRDIGLTRSYDKSHNPVLDYTDTKSLGGRLTWDKKTGKILSDGNFSYKITETLPDGTFPFMSRTSYVTGKTESFYCDPRHGTTDLTLADGTTRHIEMIIAPGPNYKAIRLVQETKKGKTRDVLRRSFDEQGRLLQEAIGLANGKERVSQYVYNNAGKVVAYLLDGKEMWKNVYDPVTGQLRERDLPKLGLKLAFALQPDGNIKETIAKAGSGAVTATQTLKPSAWAAQATSFEKVY